MKRFHLILLLVLMTTFSTLAQEYNVISYNIRFNNPNDKENWWEHRKEAVVQLLEENEPVSFGVQEAVLSQMEYIDEHMPGYSYVGVGRDDGKTDGEFSAIFYKNNLKVLKSGTFWLSTTPDKVSKGWDAALPRVCTYAQFEMEDGSVFWHFNTHFDHVGEKARAESAALIVRKIKEFTNGKDKVILTGDFNTTPDKAPYANITEYMDDAAQKTSAGIEGPIGTFSGFNLDAPLDRRIDYIFSRNIQALKYLHLDDKTDKGLWVSDHLPVVIRFSLKD